MKTNSKGHITIRAGKSQSGVSLTAMVGDELGPVIYLRPEEKWRRNRGGSRWFTLDEIEDFAVGLLTLVSDLREGIEHDEEEGER